MSLIAKCRHLFSNFWDFSEGFAAATCRPLDPAEIGEFVGDCIEKDLHCIVVCGVFAPVNDEQELRAVTMVEGKFTSVLDTFRRLIGLL